MNFHEHMARGRAEYHRSHRGGMGSMAFGLLFLMAGGLAMAMQLHLIPSFPLWQLWPVLLLPSALRKLLQPRGASSRLMGACLLAASLYLLAWYRGMVLFSWDWFWPILLMVVGLKWILRSMGSSKWEGRGGRLSTEPGDGPLAVVLNMAGAEHHFEGRRFEGGSIKASAAGYKLDLRGCTVASESSVLELDVVLGGVDLYVPSSWVVDVQVEPVLGGLENKTRHYDLGEKPHRLLITGRLVMGGLEIRN